MLSLWLSMAMQDFRDVLPLINVPVLITYGTQSALFRAENSVYQHENIKGSKLLAFEGCGHSLHMEDPEKFNREVMNFLG
jgi:pimeloyl-ACP methyl ester carboxylesterase